MAETTTDLEMVTRQAEQLVEISPLASFGNWFVVDVDNRNVLGAYSTEARAREAHSRHPQSTVIRNPMARRMQQEGGQS